MAKDVIHTHGEDIVVREDTAKAFRGVNWAMLSIGAFVIILAVLFVTLYLNAARDGSVESPTIQNSK